MDGEGTFRWANGDSYTGQWKEGHMEGNGTKTLAGGDSWTGVTHFISIALPSSIHPSLILYVYHIAMASR
jgi:hypothetical protein